MVDKILLGLLVILLPIGIIVSRQVFKPETATDGSNEAQVEKVEQLLTQLQERVETPSQPIPQNKSIEIIGLAYASESGKLRIEGKAPSSQTAVNVSVTILPAPAEIPELAESDVLGQELTFKAVKPEVDGSFVFEHYTRANDGVMEIGMRQGEAEEVMQYDLRLQKQVW